MRVALSFQACLILVVIYKISITCKRCRTDERIFKQLTAFVSSLESTFSLSNFFIQYDDSKAPQRHEDLCIAKTIQYGTYLPSFCINPVLRHFTVFGSGAWVIEEVHITEARGKGLWARTLLNPAGSPSDQVDPKLTGSRMNRHAANLVGEAGIPSGVF